MRRSVTVLAAVLIASLLAASCTTNTGRVSLVNTSPETISRASLVFSWGDKVEAINLAPSQTATLTYRITHEGDYRVHVVFQSGKRLTSSEVEYVTGGFDFRDRITVTESEIRVAHEPVTRAWPW